MSSYMDHQTVRMPTTNFKWYLCLTVMVICYFSMQKWDSLTGVATLSKQVRLSKRPLRITIFTLDHKNEFRFQTAWWNWSKFPPYKVARLPAINFLGALESIVWIFFHFATSILTKSWPSALLKYLVMICCSIPLLGQCGKLNGDVVAVCEAKGSVIDTSVDSNILM